MAIRYYANVAQTTLTTPVNSDDTTIVVATAAGLPVQYPYTLILERGTNREEIVDVLSASGTSLHVNRGVDSSPSFGHQVGATVAQGFSARDLREANAHVNATSGVHGVVGSVVGTSDTQSLTGKSISLGGNTITGTRAQFNAAMTDADFATLAGTETLTNKTLASPTITGRGEILYVEATSLQHFNQDGSVERSGQLLLTLAANATYFVEYVINGTIAGSGTQVAMRFDGTIISSVYGPGAPAATTATNIGTFSSGPGTAGPTSGFASVPWRIKTGASGTNLALAFVRVAGTGIDGLDVDAGSWLRATRVA